MQYAEMKMFEINLEWNNVSTNLTQLCILLKNEYSFNDPYICYLIPTYVYVPWLRPFTDHLQHGPRLCLPMTMLYEGYTVCIWFVKDIDAND